jgi:hypothetical protein
LIGGTLSRPQDHWPHLFSHPFWIKYPYFLPCIVVAACACLSFVILALFFKEVRLLYFEEYGRNICDTDCDFYPFDCTSARED